MCRPEDVIVNVGGHRCKGFTVADVTVIAPHHPTDAERAIVEKEIQTRWPGATMKWDGDTVTVQPPPVERVTISIVV